VPFTSPIGEAPEELVRGVASRAMKADGTDGTEANEPTGDGHNSGRRAASKGSGSEAAGTKASDSETAASKGSDTATSKESDTATSDTATSEVASKADVSEAGTSKAGTGGATEEAETQEDVEALRNRVQDLEKKVADSRAKQAARIRQRWRTVLAWVFVVVGSLLALISVFAVFARNQLLNTDNYVATVAPLGSNPAIQSNIATIAADQLLAKVDVRHEIEQVLPPRADVLAGPLTSAVNSAVHAAANKITHSERFEELWVKINRAGHQALVNVLTGSTTGAVRANSQGVVTLDLHTLAVKVQQALVAQGLTFFSKIPADKVGGTVTLLKSDQLVKAQRATRILKASAIVLPILALACYVVAVAVARRKRRTLMYCGAGLAIAMGIIGIALGLARTGVINASHGHALTPDAAAAFFDTFVRNVHNGIRIIFVIGLLVVVIAWLAGPSRPAVAVRKAAMSAWNWFVEGIRDRGFNLGPATPWLTENRSWLQGVVIALGLILLVFWTPGWVGALVIVLLAVFIVLVLRSLGHKAAVAADQS